MSGHFALYEACRLLVASTGKAAFIGEATGRPATPYAVLNADWEPEPDVGQELLGTPGALKAAIQVNCYGRQNVDALWLDAAAYTAMMAETTVFSGINVIWRDADDSPVLSRTDQGLILSKHWYRFVYSAE